MSASDPKQTSYHFPLCSKIGAGIRRREFISFVRGTGVAGNCSRTVSWQTPRVAFLGGNRMASWLGSTTRGAGDPSPSPL